MDKVKYYIGIYGERVGFALIVLVSVWDLLYTGVRGFPEYRIGVLGVVAIWLGAILISLSKHFDENF